MEVNRTITSAILTYMKEKGITYRQVADLTDKSAQNVWNILNGKSGAKGNAEREPTYRNVMDICKALGITITLKKCSEKANPDKLLDSPELSLLPFSFVQNALLAAGYTICVRMPEDS